jgi:D-glycero-D-manno-heptose 1,7-bisphosphate phosphatase
MRPLTDDRPKPMIEFHGKPFLQYLVEQVRDQGFQRVTLLVGYLGEAIIEHFQDGSHLGIEIDYSHIPAENLTSRRVQAAAERLDETFLLMYCDNYWPLRFDDLWDAYVSAGAPVQVTVYANRDGYSKSNVRTEDGFVVEFDPTRTMPGLSGVEIGYAIVDRDVTLSLLPGDQAVFERAVYPTLVERRDLGAYVTDHRYYSVGSLERLPVTERFLRRAPAVILDRDGTLNVRPARATYITCADELRWLPGALEALRLLCEAGHSVHVVSNQAGVNRGALTPAALDEIHARLRADAAAAGGRIDSIFVCPHDWDEGCLCRKPRPGMLFDAQHAHDLDLSRTFFLGDDERDGEAAEAAGCPFARVTEERPLLEVVRDLLAGTLTSEVRSRSEHVYGRP